MDKNAFMERSVLRRMLLLPRQVAMSCRRSAGLGAFMAAGFAPCSTSLPLLYCRIAAFAWPTVDERSSLQPTLCIRVHAGTVYPPLHPGRWWDCVHTHGIPDSLNGLA